MKAKPHGGALPSFVPPDPVRIGPALKKARQQLRLSQDELAGILGVNRNTVINWENDRNQPDLTTLAGLCHLLRISPRDLFPDDAPLSPPERAVIENLRALRPETREAVCAMIFAMLEKEQSAHADQLRQSFRVVLREPGSLSAGTAGHGSAFPEDRGSPFFLRLTDRTVKADAVIRVSGRSMEPVYHDGDEVYFRRSVSADPGEDVVVAWAGEQYVKRMGPDGALYSVNPDFPFHYDSGGDDIVIRGRVLGIVSSADRPADEDLPLLEELFHDELAVFDRL